MFVCRGGGGGRRGRLKKQMKSEVFIKTTFNNKRVDVTLITFLAYHIHPRTLPVHSLPHQILHLILPEIH